MQTQPLEATPAAAEPSLPPAQNFPTVNNAYYRSSPHPVAMQTQPTSLHPAGTTAAAIIHHQSPVPAAPQRLPESVFQRSYELLENFKDKEQPSTPALSIVGSPVGGTLPVLAKEAAIRKTLPSAKVSCRQCMHSNRYSHCCFEKEWKHS